MSVLDVISTLLREGRRLLALHALLDRLFQSTPLREGRQQMFPDFLKEFRNTSTYFVVLDEICGCEVPGFEGERHENVVRKCWGFYDSLGFARSALRR